jgi:hypothetical protein
MLKLTDDGAKVTLQGQPIASDNGLFWFGSALLIGAIAVAMAMSLLPERLSIGALALLIIGSFIFNKKRQRQKKASSGIINSGVLWIKAQEIIHDNQGKRESIQLVEGDTVTLFGEQIQIVDANDNRRYHISGFENIQEAQATKAILQGQALNKRHVNIKMSEE